MKKIIISIAACGVLALGARLRRRRRQRQRQRQTAAAAATSPGTITIDGSSTVVPFAQAAQRSSRARTRT